eukprot:364563-Chlamydomonas_euryale.AAC.6
MKGLGCEYACLAEEFKKPQQAGCMTRSCARRGGSPGLVNGALCNDCDLAAEDVEVVASGKASVKSKEKAVSGQRSTSALSAAAASPRESKC